MKFKVIFFPILLAVIFSCKKETLAEIPTKTNPNLNYYGFTLIDVGWDDPQDKEIKVNYLDEVSAFTNMADILVAEPADNLVGRVQAMNTQGVKAMLHLHELFFYQTGTSEGVNSGLIYSLRIDYQQRWNDFKQINLSVLNSGSIACFYIGEEPAWNGISEADFTLATDYVKSTIADVKILTVEAYPALDIMYAPSSVDWIGFDHYFLPEPSSDATFIQEYQKLSSLRKVNQKIILIMDSHWIKYFHGSAGISKSDMDFIARDYYTLANSDTNVAGIIGYFWPGGFDNEKSLGARNLPDNVLEEYKKIGKQITGK